MFRLWSACENIIMFQNKVETLGETEKKKTRKKKKKRKKKIALPYTYAVTLHSALKGLVIITLT